MFRSQFSNGLLWSTADEGRRGQERRVLSAADEERRRGRVECYLPMGSSAARMPPQS
jgi:hypothetical protein